MTTKFYTQTAPAYFCEGGNIQDIYIYNENGIIVKFDYARIELGELIENGILTSVNEYSRKLEAINLTAVKRANKINLSRKDNFMVNTSSDAYIPHPYDLYIYAGVGGDLEILSRKEYPYGHDNNGEQWFMNAYEIKFNCGAIVGKNHSVKIPCENYTLKEGETFGSGRGTKENPIIRTYDTNDYIFKKNIKPEKGVIRSWWESETVFSTLFIKDSLVSRIEKTEERLNRETLSGEIEKIIGYHIPDYKMSELLNHYSITKKA